jgi:alanine-synthesizing transaminase
MGPRQEDRRLTLPPLSQRFPFHGGQNAITRARLAAGPLCDLSISNPTQAGLSVPQAGPAFTTHYTPSASGSLPAREAISAYYARQFQAAVSPERIVLCASTSEGYSFCLKFIADPHDEILIPQPSYPLLQHLVAAEGLTPIPYPIHAAGADWLLDREALASRVTPRTKAIVAVHPNNPTGQYMPPSDVAWLQSLAQDRLWLISDEVFADYAWPPHAPRSLANSPHANTVVLSGLSKICGLPQMKLAWILLPSPQLREPFEWVSDTYLSVSAPIEQATPHWLANSAASQAPIRQRCLANLNFLRSATLGPWNVLPPEAGWTAILRGPATQSEETIVLDLIAKGFFIQPGFYYDLPFEPALVLSLLTPTEDLARFLKVIAF